MSILEILEAATRADLAKAVARELRGLLGARGAYCALSRDGVLEVAAVEGTAPAVSTGSSTPPTLSSGAEVHALGGGAARFLTRGLSAAPNTAAVLVPIGTHGVVVALVDHAPDAAHLEQATFLGATANAAFRHLRAHEETRGLNRRLSALLELQRALASGILEDAFSAFAHRLRSEVEFDLAWIGSIAASLDRVDRPGHNDVELLAAEGLEAQRAGALLSIVHTPLGAVLQSARARAGGPTFLDAADAASFAPWARSGVVLPLAMHDAIVGVFVLLSRKSMLARASLLPDAAWLLAAIAEPLAMAAQNAGLVGRLRGAMRDWQATFDVMDAIVLVADEAGTIRRANWALAKRLGTTPSALRGKSAAALFPGQQLPTAQSPKSTLVGPRGEPLRASGVNLPDGGTVIVMHDARTTAASSSATMPALRRVSTGSNIVRGRVLIVDDEPSILRAVSRTLARTHEVITASDGDEALDLIRRDPLGFDAVMTDVQMPRMSGVELYRAIEREIPAIAERVLFMTGGVFAPDVEAFLRGLKERVLRKPFDPDLLRRTIDERVALSRVA